MSKEIRLSLIAIFTSLLSFFSLQTAFAATTYTVCATGCDFTTIQSANNSSTIVNGDTILVSTTVHTEVNIVLTKNLTVQGLGTNQTIVQAAATQASAAGRVFKINAGVVVTLRNMTIRHGYVTTTGTSERGGGIQNLGTLGLISVLLEQNQTSENDGGAIYNEGPLSIDRSTIRNNVASRGTGSTSGQSAKGGAIYNTGTAGQVTIKNSTFNGNRAQHLRTSGIGNDALGGAIYDTASGDIVILNSTFSGNSVSSALVQDGGAIYSTGTGTTIKLSNATIVGASATSGIYNTSASIITFKNGILSGYAGVAGNCVNTGTFTQQGTNRIESGVTCGTLTAPTNLGTLADNGGDTETIALLSGSNAIDGTTSCTDVDGATISFDQRGVPRPLGTNCDIGAFEYEDTSKVNSTFAAAITSKLFVATPDVAYPAYSAYGVTTLNTLFTNTHASTVSSVYLKVNTISSGKYLLNANGGPAQVDGVKFMALSMNSGEGLPVTIQIGHTLVKGNFAFKVDVWGKNAVIAADASEDIYLGTVEFVVDVNAQDEQSQQGSFDHRIFLPAVQR